MQSLKYIHYFLEDEIAYFPHLQDKLIHGFSWGKNSKNMDFSRGSIPEVKSNVKDFLQKLNLPPIYETFNVKAEHKDNIIFIDQEYKDQSNPNPLGRTLNCDAAFTNCKDVCITVKPADCSTAIVYAKSSTLGEITGLIHAGRRGIDLMFPQKCINYLVNELKCTLDSISINIVPYLFQESRRYHDTKELKLDSWSKYIIEKDGYFYPAEVEFAIDQYLSTGILESNLTVYNIDTYKSAKNGLGFSYKFHYDATKEGLGVRDGRFIVATKLR